MDVFIQIKFRAHKHCLEVVILLWLSYHNNYVCRLYLNRICVEVDTHHKRNNLDHLQQKVYVTLDRCIDVVFCIRLSTNLALYLQVMIYVSQSLLFFIYFQEVIVNKHFHIETYLNILLWIKVMVKICLNKNAKTKGMLNKSWFYSFHFGYHFYFQV